MQERNVVPKPGPVAAARLRHFNAHGQSRARAAESRCCRQTDLPYEWHDYYAVINPELDAFRNWFNSIPSVVQDVIFGVLEDLFIAAADGLADPYDNDEPIKAMRGAIDSFELRALLDPDVPGIPHELFRHYHYEPQAPWDTVLVALHAHLKNTVGTAEEVRARQTRQMEFAYERCELGRSRVWNLPTDTGDLVERLLGL